MLLQPTVAPSRYLPLRTIDRLLLFWSRRSSWKRRHAGKRIRLQKIFILVNKPHFCQNMELKDCKKTISLFIPCSYAHCGITSQSGCHPVTIFCHIENLDQWMTDSISEKTERKRRKWPLRERWLTIEWPDSAYYSVDQAAHALRTQAEAQGIFSRIVNFSRHFLGLKYFPSWYERHQSWHNVIFIPCTRIAQRKQDNFSFTA